MILRPYQPTDRAAVREICWQTADAGRPGDALAIDRELLADLVTRAQTDFWPDWSWVAEDAGAVVGYLLGAPRSGWRWPPSWRRATVRLAWAGWRSRPRARVRWREFPGVAHVNLLPAARGQGSGRALYARFEQRALAAGLRGVHASVRGDNAGGRRFFERLGFAPVAEWPLAIPRQDGWCETKTIIYGKSLAGVAGGNAVAGVQRGG